MPRDEDVQADLALVIRGITNDLAAVESWPPPVLLDGMALCVMNSIYSTGNRSESVVRVLDRYRTRRRSVGADPSTDGPKELLVEIAQCGGPEGFANALQNHWRAWSRKTAPYKTVVIHGAAQLLDMAGVHTRDQLESALGAPETHDALKRGWHGLPGQRSGLTWRYFLMNSGMPGIKADRMITRWTSRAVNRSVKPEEAEQLLTAAARELVVDPRHLDHALWTHERGRK